MCKLDCAVDVVRCFQSNNANDCFDLETQTKSLNGSKSTKIIQDIFTSIPLLSRKLRYT